ncbi:MAG: HD domain-containing protein [Chloroflexaceae bacterium]|nr:HD domain-containing protein [Chloroflexaceae bacterium]
MLAATTILLVITGIAPWIEWLDFPFERTITALDNLMMIDQLALFMFVVIIVIMSTSYLLQSLEQSLLESREHARRAEESAHCFAQQAQELAERNARLEEVERELRVSMAQTEKRLAHIQALQRIDQAIATNQDVYKTLDIALTQVAVELQVDAAAVWLTNPVGHTIEYIAGRGLHFPIHQRSHPMNGNTCAVRVATEQRMVCIDQTGASEHCTSPVLETHKELTQYYGVPLIARNQVKGVLELFQRTPIQPDQEWLSFLNILAGQTAIAIDHAELLAELQRTNDELTLAYDATIMALAHALELRDAETEGHSRRVTELTLQLARQMNFDDETLVHIGRGAILHDIGKMAVPDAILLKSGPLTQTEYTIMQQHTIYAYNMLAPIPFLQPALDIPYCHHEKWDGSGYPRRLKHEEIPLAARIFAVIDVYDALGSDRPYRKRWSLERIKAYLDEQAGVHFDPTVVHLFCSISRIFRT